MSQRRLYGLLVGINEYPPPVSWLGGCVNDVNHYYDYLQESFGHLFNLRIEVLKNSDATRANIIRLFRDHLCKAGKHDVVLFQYSGHGSREMSAPEFKEYFPGEKDETLVCYDSRTSGGFDLADKELAVLLREVAQNNPHIAVILDCCHSGSGTRKADDFNLVKPRQTREEWDPGTPRPIETYLEGYYKKMKTLHIPQSKHVLMAACDRTQKAWETDEGRGLFSTTLLNVLTKSGSKTSYADTFIRCRSAILSHAQNQTPQFETYERFMPYAKFLDGQPMGQKARYHVYFKRGEWQMDCGALHGLPTEAEKRIEVALYPESSVDSGADKMAGYAKVVSVKAQKSTLIPEFEYSKEDRFFARLVSLPIPPMPVLLEGDDQGKASVTEFYSQWSSFAFTDKPAAAKYVLSAQKNSFQVRHRESDMLIQGAVGTPGPCCRYIFSILEKVVRWERSLALQNHNTAFNTEDVDFNILEVLDDGTEFQYPGDSVTFDYVKEGDGWKSIPFKLRAQNRTNQTIHVALVHFSRKFGISALGNEPLLAGEGPITLLGEENDRCFMLPEGIDESVDTFKLIVSTERVDDFLLLQEDIKLGMILELHQDRDLAWTGKSTKVENDWFTKTITVRTVRQLNRVSETDTLLANGQITVKGHPSFEAKISLAGGKPHTRSTKPEQDTIISDVFEGDAYELIHFSSTRNPGSGGPGILELTDISNEESLKENPLEILLDTTLEDNEYILPMTFDGTHFLLVGNPSIDENRKVCIRIDRIPDVTDEARRSLGKALKLCFLKLILGRKNLNRLQRVEYQPDGSIIRHEDHVKEKVAKANRILLLIHGILGDSQHMAKALKLAVDENSTSIADKYDLILTFDYENLNTPIEDTAKNLKLKLKEVGLHENQDKKITILAHSMGGLVSRWFIEKDGGSKIVNRLIMTGPPNNGFVFGNIAAYRNMAITILTLALNFIKSFIPYASALLCALNESKKITQTLEQMKEGSSFVKDLYLCSDPNVRYTILAGDISDYESVQEEDEGFFARLIEKIEMGIGKLAYGAQPNDIVVSVDSMKQVDDHRQPGPEKIDLVCHHLNYFRSEVGLKALARVLSPAGR
ncbi:MAG: caspase family protein [Candidatus Aminicenantes bacterium]|nr:MAG: caspase family protein [Candidatus Aminicenantes bacterium]